MPEETKEQLVFSVQPIDEDGRIGFDDGRDVMEAETFDDFAIVARSLLDEGFDCLDVTITKPLS